MTEENETDGEIEVLEFDLFEEEIDELIAHLHDLKENKQSINFIIDDSSELIINYVKEEEND